MPDDTLCSLLDRLCALPGETEWVEFKESNDHPDMIGEYCSALSNAALLGGRETAFLVFGVRDGDRAKVGTTFNPKSLKVGNEEFENWLLRLLEPRINVEIQPFECEEKRFCILKIQPAFGRPVHFKGTAYIRVGSYKKKLDEYPEKERKLWLLGRKMPFERAVAKTGVPKEQIFELLDTKSFFKLLGINYPDETEPVLDRLSMEKMIFSDNGEKYDITNLGAILFARELAGFEQLSRKAVRIIVYEGKNKIITKRERLGVKGYASGFEGMINYINEQLPHNEHIGKVFREQRRMYPEIAIREVVANALIHQDFDATGDSPLVEIFADRIEVSNYGRPLISVLRLIDEPPQSRNEDLAAFMRRIGICEERGSGVDKLIFSVEAYQLPAPDFLVTENHMKVVLYGDRKFGEIDKKGRVRACYQHACLKYVSNEQMTNASLRERFSIEDKDYPMVSRVIADAIKEDLIKPYDPENRSRKHAKYVPFWA